MATVIVVMLIFLGLRTGLVVASLIPLAIVMALLVMSIFGIGLDQMSLASLIIALGFIPLFYSLLHRIKYSAVDA